MKGRRYEVTATDKLYRVLPRFDQIKTHDWTQDYKSSIKNNPAVSQFRINNKRVINALCFDIDDAEDAFLWDELGLPQPSIQTFNKFDRKCHLVYLLESPVDKEQYKPYAWAKSILMQMRSMLKGDVAYTNTFTKNFYNTTLFEPIIIDSSYTLADLQSYLPKINTPLKAELTDPIGSRHISLFESLRRPAYKMVNQVDEDGFLTWLRSEADAINESFDEPIKTKHIVRSIYTFCIENRHNFGNNQGKNRGAYAKYLKDGMTLPEKQSKSAELSREKVMIKTELKIEEAIKILGLRGSKISNTSIAAKAGVSTKTVQRYKKRQAQKAEDIALKKLDSRCA